MSHAPRILVVHPAHMFSTADVYTGLVAGLRANGCTVHGFNLAHTIREAWLLAESAKAQGVPDAFRPDPWALAARGVPGAAMATRAEIVIVITGSDLHPTAVEALRLGGVLTAVLCTESPYMTHVRELADASFYDVVCTNERKAVPLFTHNDPATVHYLPHAYNPEVHHPGPADPTKVCDVSFIGTAFPERRELFAGVDWRGIEAVVRGPDWPGIEVSPFPVVESLTENAEVAAWYRSARININHHRTTTDYTDEHAAMIDPAIAESLGPRAYEIAACGGFQIMDDSRPEAREVFGNSLVTYRSGDSADLERKIRYYLAHPAERAALARKQHQAVRAHTWTCRAAQMLTILTRARAFRAEAIARA